MIAISKRSSAVAGVMVFIAVAGWLLIVSVPKFAAREHPEPDAVLETAARAVLTEYVRENQDARSPVDPMKDLGKWQGICRRSGLDLTNIYWVAKDATRVDDVKGEVPVLRLDFADGKWATVGFGYFDYGR